MLELIWHLLCPMGSMAVGAYGYYWVHKHVAWRKS